MTIIYLDPNGNGTTQQWSTSDYTNINDGLREPTAPSDGGPECYSFTEDEVCEWTFPNIGATTGTTSVVRIWLWTDQTEPKSANLKWDGVWQTTNVTKDGSSIDWDRYDFTIVDDLSSGITDIQARLTSGSGGDDSVEALYIEVVHDGPPPGSAKTIIIDVYHNEEVLFNAGRDA